MEKSVRFTISMFLWSDQHKCTGKDTQVVHLSNIWRETVKCLAVPQKGGVSFDTDRLVPLIVLWTIKKINISIQGRILKEILQLILALKEEGKIKIIVK